jgi:hypothetical protein
MKIEKKLKKINKKILKLSKKVEKLQKKKWKVHGFYYDGKDHWDIYEDERGNLKNVKPNGRV